MAVRVYVCVCVGLLVLRTAEVCLEGMYVVFGKDEYLGASSASTPQ